MSEQWRTPAEYLAVAKRRKRALLLPFFVFSGLAVLLALFLPPTYRAVATVVLEGEEIPAGFTDDAVQSLAEQRLRMIRQRILSTGKLLDIMKREGLFAYLSGKANAEEMATAMRDAVRLDYAGAEIVEGPAGQSGTGSITFILSFEAREKPVVVQKIANILAALFLEENLREQRGQHRDILAVLEEKRRAARRELDDVTRRIALFKKEHINELPEVLPVNLQSRHAVDAAIELLNDQLRTLREREERLAAALSAVSPRQEEEERQRLAALKVEQANLESRYTAEHPDVTRIRQEIVRLEERLAAGTATEQQSAPADNPVFVSLSGQLAAIRDELKAANRQLADQEARRALLTAWIEAAPRVEMAYHDLLARQREAQTRNDDLSRRLEEAKTAGLTARDGQRFTVIDPASLPLSPSRPNRPVIVLAGLFCGLFAGGCCVFLLEACDSSIRWPETLERETSYPVLAVIPVITTGSEIRQRSNARILIVAGVLLVIAVLAALIFFLPDQAALWEKLRELLPLLFGG